MSDFYVILGITRLATADEIKKAFRKEALKWHPDKNQGNVEEAEQKFKLIAEAYDTLGDESKRSHYDRYGNTEPRQSSHPDRNAHDLFSQFFSQQDPFASMFGSFSERASFPHSFSNSYAPMQHPFNQFAPFAPHSSHGSQQSFMQSFSSSSSSAPFGFAMSSSSTQTSIVNGVRTTVKSQTDQNGNTTTETLRDDGRGNVSRSVEQGSRNNSQGRLY